MAAGYNNYLLCLTNVNDNLVIFALIPYSKNVLNKRLENFQDRISEHAPCDIPVMLLTDNINDVQRK